MNKQRTPNVLGVLLRYAGLINIIIGGTNSLGKCDPSKLIGAIKKFATFHD
nr:MAG TPA: hypothetical protein [Caudoviricetes sp.]